jgi:hypothetical protein
MARLPPCERQGSFRNPGPGERPVLRRRRFRSHDEFDGYRTGMAIGPVNALLPDFARPVACRPAMEAPERRPGCVARPGSADPIVSLLVDAPRISSGEGDRRGNNAGHVLRGRMRVGRLELTRAYTSPDAARRCRTHLHVPRPRGPPTLVRGHETTASRSAVAVVRRRVRRLGARHGATANRNRKRDPSRDPAPMCPQSVGSHPFEQSRTLHQGSFPNTGPCESHLAWL